MTIYRIIRDTAEVALSEARPGCTLDQGTQNHYELARYTDQAEARRALAGYTATLRPFRSPAGLLVQVTETLLETCETDEDGELLSTGDYDVCPWPDTLYADGDTYTCDPRSNRWTPSPS
jgi:hypothetical protein